MTQKKWRPDGRHLEERRGAPPDGRIQVDFANVPKGVRVTPAAGIAPGISTNVGYDNSADVGNRWIGGIG